MTPAQTASFAFTKSPNGRLHVVLAEGEEFDLRPFSVLDYDALLLQGTDAIVSTARRTPCLGAPRRRESCSCGRQQRSPAFGRRLRQHGGRGSKRAPITLSLTQALNVAIEHGPVGDPSIVGRRGPVRFVLSIHVQRVESTNTVRLSHAQWKGLSHVSAAKVILTVRSAEDLRLTDLAGVHTLELFEACKATVDQVQGKTIVGGTTHLACYADGTVPASFSFKACAPW